MKVYQEWHRQHPAKAALLMRCAVAIREIEPKAEVILYGSVARGEETPGSDVDLLVLLPQEATPQLRRMINDQVYEVELEKDQIITTIVRGRDDWQSFPQNMTSLHRVIEAEGVRI